MGEFGGDRVSVWVSLYTRGLDIGVYSLRCKIDGAWFRFRRVYKRRKLAVVFSFIRYCVLGLG